VLDALTLREPSLDLLPAYEDALATGWSPNTTRDVSAEQLAALWADPVEFLRDLLRQDGMICLGDGRLVPKLPCHVFWIWDGEFCGSINLRFQRGTEELPAHVSGHVGYAIVPWKRGRGYATRALSLLLPIARCEGLARILATCDEDNFASRKVIAANGGVAAGMEPNAENAAKCKLLFWISTSSDGI
jgi:predicted acetyltransferase